MSKTTLTNDQITWLERHGFDEEEIKIDKDGTMYVEFEQEERSAHEPDMRTFTSRMIVGAEY